VNKAIIPAVIIVGVVAIILSSFQLDIDMKIDGAEPLDPLFVSGEARDNGEIVCPDGKTKDTSKIYASLNFAEDETGSKGRFSMFTQGSNPQREISGNLYNGNVTSSEYQVYGVARPNAQLHEQCGFDGYPQLMVITVWGLCGEGVTINFETNTGYKGSSVGTVVCV